MSCKVLPSDAVSKQLKSLTPSGLNGLPQTAKLAGITAAYASALPGIITKVTGVITNFKNIEMGLIPELPSIKLDKTFTPTPITFDKDSPLKLFEDTKNKLSADKLKSKATITNQLKCLDDDDINAANLANSQGDLFNSIKASVGSITTRELIDLNDPKLLLKKVLEVSNDAVEQGAKSAANQKDHASEINKQIKSVDALRSLV